MMVQSIAREYGSLGIHVGHVVIDGVVEGEKVQTAFRVTVIKRRDGLNLARSPMLFCHARPTPLGVDTELDIRPFEKF